MRIAIDATGISAYQTGTVTYLLEILAQWNRDTEIHHEFIVYCAPAAKHHFERLSLDKRFRFEKAPSAKLARMVWQQTLLPYSLWRNQVDVHWGPGFILPCLPICPMAVTVHDMTFDLMPEVHEPIKRFYFPFMIRRSIKRARCVFAISNATAKDLQRLIPASVGKTQVTPLAARSFSVKKSDAGAPSSDSHASASMSAGKPDIALQPYVLFVGTLEPRKNLDRLLQAWQSLPAAVRGQHRLVVIGIKGWMVDQLCEQRYESVDFLGHVSDEALGEYVRGATCFAYPSLYEGFGLPVIEAMAAGVPVLTSEIGATQEVAHGAALLVDPTSISSIAEGLSRLLLDPVLREQLSAAGPVRAAEFSWARTASLTLRGLEGI